MQVKQYTLQSLEEIVFDETPSSRTRPAPSSEGRQKKKTEALDVLVAASYLPAVDPAACLAAKTTVLRHAEESAARARSVLRCGTTWFNFRICFVFWVTPTALRLNIRGIVCGKEGKPPLEAP